MQHTGVAAGPGSPQRTIIAASAGLAASAQSPRKGGAEPLSGVNAAERIERRDQSVFSRRADDTIVHAPASATADRRAHHNRREGEPSSAFLAQHIAQEVEPEDPGFAAFQSGTRAYVLRRDSTVEFLSAEGRVDFFV